MFFFCRKDARGEICGHDSDEERGEGEAGLQDQELRVRGNPDLLEEGRSENLRGPGEVQNKIQEVR